MAFTEFYCQSGGLNLNAGSDNNNAAKYTAVNGNWDNINSIYTPTDGSNPVSVGVAVGDYASVYIDGATVGVVSARITAVVNAVNGTITLSASVRAGQAPATSVTARSIKVGGAWKGMGGTINFPFGLPNLGSLRNPAVDPPVRILIKNDQVYTMGNVTTSVQGTEPAMVKGYAATADDDGIATIVQTSTFNTLWTHQVDVAGIVKNIEFSCTAASGTINMVAGGSSHTYDRCIFHGSRGTALTNGARMTMIECEFYDNNRSNTVNSGCAEADIDTKFIRCNFHDCTVSNGNGILFGQANRCVPFIDNCIFDTLSGSGILAAGGSGNPVGLQVRHSDFYNIGVSGIRFLTGANPCLYVESCNFLKCTQYGIDASPISGGTFFIGKLANNGYGSGTMANGLGDTNGIGSVQEINKVVYAANTTPWLDPNNGSFNIILSAAISAGRGAFLTTAPSYGPTVGFEDIGAAPADATPFHGIGGSAYLPDGYVGKPYLWEVFFDVTLAVTIAAGSLPPGLVLSQPTGSSYEISGNPTAVGTYTFTVRHTHGTNSNDVIFRIIVSALIIVGGGGDEGGGEPLVVELPRPTIKVRDPELAGVLRRARRAVAIIEDMTIAGAGGNSEDGFSL